MSENLGNFLVDLATDPGLMARFLSDPSGALQGVNLDVEEQAALTSRDSDQLRRALGGWSLASNGQSMNGKKKKGKKGGKKKATKKKGGKKR
jgi:hypothetical protein